MKKEQLIKKGLLVGVGIAAYIQEKTEKFARELVKKGHLDREEGKRLVKSIYQEADNSRKKLGKIVESELKKLIKRPAKSSKKKGAKKKIKKKK
jgi:polyhydroxyalkanoate synthesis regulator phasin